MAGAIAAGMMLEAANGVVNNLMAKDRESSARWENYQYNEKSAVNAYQRQKKLLDAYYTPEAQIQHLKNAGLSPSLMYGQGGATGTTTTAQGQGATGIQPNIFGINPMLGAMQAQQIKLMEAQARELNAKADTEEGKNERGAAEISKILAENGNIDADTNLKNAMKFGKDIENKINNATTEEQIDKIVSESKHAHEAYTQAMYLAAEEGIKFEIANETKEEQIAQIRKNVELTTQKILESKQNVKYSQAQIREISAQITRWANQTAIENYHEQLYSWSNERQNEYWKAQIDQQVKNRELDKQFKNQELKLWWADLSVGTKTKILEAGLHTAGNILGAGIIAGARK